MPNIQFKGKSFVQNHHLAVPYHELVPDAKKSKTDKVALHDNLVVHGDNLLALKALLPTYAGKFKCITIDPPYNTGGEEWVYSDGVSGPVVKEWIGKVVGKEGEDLTRHDKWLCMMLPRLKLLRELLSDDGAIFITIDDNEQHHLRMLCDEVFGSENFLAQVVWQHSVQPKGYSGKFSVHHNYCLCYRKSEATELHSLERTAAHNVNYSNPDNDPRGPWRSGDVRNALDRPNLKYDVTTPSGKKIEPPKNGWRWSRETMDRKIETGEIYFNRSETRVMRKIYLADVEGRAPETIWFGEEVGTTRSASAELKEIFDGTSPFETPKPTALIKRMLHLVTDQDSLVLDSFAGSGTTAQAVLELNREDGGRRAFVLVEMEDYADTITAERVRRVIDGVPSAKSENLRAGHSATFSYFELGDAIETDSLLSGTKMPSYKNLARYIFFTATGEEFNDSKLDEKTHFVGSSSEYDVYMYYKPDAEYLKSTALTLDEARSLRERAKNRPLLVFAPTKYIEQTELDNLKITFCQLPFEIYKVKAHGAT